MPRKAPLPFLETRRVLESESDCPSHQCGDVGLASDDRTDLGTLEPWDPMTVYLVFLRSAMMASSAAITSVRSTLCFLNCRRRLKVLAGALYWNT